jgi:hypothetical protein
VVATTKAEGLLSVFGKVAGMTTMKAQSRSQVLLILFQSGNGD